MAKTVAFRKNARNIFFHILTKCNLKCAHCYVNPLQHGKKTLAVDTVKKWLEQLIDQEKESNLVLIGGEPTLHPDLPGIIKHAKELGYSSITVDTNGFFFNEILEKASPADIDYFSVGLDGSCQEVNDRIRGRGSFDKSVAGIKEALKRGFRVSMIYTVNGLNIQDVKNVPPLLKVLGVDRLFMQVVGIRGRSAHGAAGDLQVTRKQWDDVVPAAAAEAAQGGIHVTYPKVFLQTGEAFECAGLVAKNFFVFPNGRVYQCPLCEDFPLHAYVFEKDRLTRRPPLNESDLFQLSIPEGCVMNKLVQPGNLSYDNQGRPRYKIACCLLKEVIEPKS
jgi:Fe-coproporphyrin III synthase